MRADVSSQRTWPNKAFTHSEWGPINYFIGPNGTRKSAFAVEMRSYLGEKFGWDYVRYVSPDRLSGIENESFYEFQRNSRQKGFRLNSHIESSNGAKQFGLVGDCFLVLKQRLDLRLTVEAALTRLLDREMFFEEIAGYLIPKARYKGAEYLIQGQECHGVKELIGLLSVIYDDYRCVIIDEPELHLHPQLQTFLLGEMRKRAGEPEEGKCAYFIATHSPFMLDLRTSNDLENCLFFRPDDVPTCAAIPDQFERQRIDSLLSRMNAHQKQFFFANQPVFVEGHTDEVILHLIQQKRNAFTNFGDSLIPAGGKDELEAFFKLSQCINKPAKFIADLDVISNGKLIEAVSKNARFTEAVAEGGIASDYQGSMNAFWQNIDEILHALDSESCTNKLFAQEPSLSQFFQALSTTSDKQFRRLLLLKALSRSKKQFFEATPALKAKITFVERRFSAILSAWKACGISLLPKGELECYLPSCQNIYQISSLEKKNIYLNELTFLQSLSCFDETAGAKYSDLFDVLNWAFPSIEFPVERLLNMYVSDWIHAVQMACKNHPILSIEDLQARPSLNYEKHASIFEILSFQNVPGDFICELKFRNTVDAQQRSFKFGADFVPSAFKLETLTQSEQIAQ